MICLKLQTFCPHIIIVVAQLLYDSPNELHPNSNNFSGTFYVQNLATSVVHIIFKISQKHWF